MNAALRNRDREMILKPRNWPMLVLPLKRHKDGLECAVLAVPMNVMEIAPDATLEIRLGTIFDKLSDAPVKQYADVDSLLDDGWMVD